ncbi:pentapeptide repeat-containing protein [Kovacikia minuta CCNUW1]|uniref:pentapeptide repeat-containing protein n=1 Tax=Kovacikia minuta TaxID=2931930 RepID=UPI001CC98EA7|nr:pentapeptide repeat-containing protein [Kovacikia minuta]UBF23910.1 pentapeptide repeat-containing protein [Kovacikia minuta CCNUW1]
MKAEELLKKYAAGDRNFPGVNLSEANLTGASLSNVNLTGANLSVANLSGANLNSANLTKAKLNVAKLSGANLSKSNLSEAILNVANLTLADLSGAELSQASFVRAELSRADLSGANLSQTNFSGADLKDAKLRATNLSNANLSRADLKWANLTAANLTGTNLHGADLSSTDFSGADLSNTELRQANLSRANLKGANLSQANLRWADLSGADLSGADLSGAKLSGANLTGANLSNSTLLETTLVHVDLTRANLIGVDWAGADLSGATLTGAKLHAAPRFGIKTEGIHCDWVDISPNGDQSNICRLTPEDYKTFFHETPPAVRLVVDAPLNQDAHYALALAFRQIVQHYRISFSPPNLQSSRRRTTLTFELESNDQLFLMSCVVVLPFQDGVEIQKRAIALIQMIQSEAIANHLQHFEPFQQLNATLSQISKRAQEFKLSQASLDILGKLKFFQSPTKTTLINSSNQTLNLYKHPLFGKKLTENLDPISSPVVLLHNQPEVSLSPGTVINFIQGFQ